MFIFACWKRSQIVWMMGFIIGPGTRKRALYIVNPAVTTKMRSFISPFNSVPPYGWFFNVCPRGYWHSRISPYSLVNFSKLSVILRKLMSDLGVSRQNFCPRVGKYTLSSIKWDTVASFQAFPPSSFWSLAVCKNRGGRPGIIYHGNDVMST